MNRKDFSRIVAEKTGNTIKDTENFIIAIFDNIKEVVKTGEEIKFEGIGFSLKNVEAKVGRNPKTGEVINIEAKKKIKVKLYKGFEVTE